MPGTFEPPEDVEQPDATLPPGTIVVDLHDADDKPVPSEQVTLGVLINSIAKGDSRKHFQATHRRARPRRLLRSGHGRQHRLPGQRRLPGRRIRRHALPAPASQGHARGLARLPGDARHPAGAHRGGGHGGLRGTRGPHPGRAGAHHLQPRPGRLAARRRAHEAPRRLHGLQRAGLDERPGRRRGRGKRPAARDLPPRPEPGASSAGSSRGRATQTSTSKWACPLTWPSRA